jgi:DegV family protein with EDD domain
LRIITNPGSNLTQRQIERYGIILTPQTVMADGVAYPTQGLSVADIDGIIATAKAHPHVLGTSAAEFVTLFHDLAVKDPEIIVITNSRRIVGSYDAAMAAVRTLQTLPAFRQVNIAVVDSMQSDLGAGLLTLFCAESARLGKPFAAIVDAARKLAQEAHSVFVPMTLDFLVKSGRASFLKSMAANLLGKLPVVEFRNGELVNGGTVSKSANIAQHIADKLGQLAPPGDNAMLGVVHAHNLSAMEDLSRRLRSMYAPWCLQKREVSAGVYLSSGPAFGGYVLPMRNAPWAVDIPSEEPA